MAKVTNNHTGTLNIAGIDVRPGATAFVADDAYTAWSKRHGAKIWLKEKIVTVAEVAEEATTTTNDAKKDDTTTTLVTAADDAKKDDAGTDAAAQAATERAALLEEARALGLNPNKNTGTEKLKKLIADKKAE